MASHHKLILTFLKIADLAVLAASFLAAMMVAGVVTETGSAEILEMQLRLRDVLFTIAYLALWHSVFTARGLYDSYRLSAASRELGDILNAVLIASACLAPSILLFGYPSHGTTVLVSFAGIAFISLGLERQTLRAIARRVRKYGRNLRNVIIVGTGDQAVELTSRLARREDLGYRVVGVIETGNWNGNGNGKGHANPFPIIAQVESLLARQPVDEIFVALPLGESDALVRGLIAVCEEEGVTVRVLAHVANLYWAHARVDAVEGQPVLTIYTGAPDAFGLFFKRIIDLVGATVGLILLTPVFLIVALLIKFDSAGPVVFAQDRVGQNRRRFPAYKFRTMVVGAEKMQAALEPLNEAQGPVFKIANDPRVTRVGYWLRKLSIDELPQLVNVLKGEMSLVGPRPLPVRDVNRIDVRWHRRRFSVKPGITCLWQVNSREPQFDEWVRSDMEYIDNWSLALDLKILAKTIPAVISGQGAH
jgi:exopolysaccharide biosynthesis polyprenyl glycosylphosphotransferase